jgi:2-polyprenyl-3-methyl-5-hydroxy-6-metoxy-1,4-benzoquinol methylase
LSLPKVKSLSSDANWGNIRHAKGLRLDSQKLNLRKILGRLIEGSSVLDIGSSRGQFLNWAQSEFPHLVFLGVEPDESLISSTAVNAGIPVICSYYGDADEIQNERYDFIFCNHTLEHVDDALDMLRRMKNHLNPGGRVWIDFPNIEGTVDPFLYEEFFIDKHMFHFSPETLTRMLAKVGFVVEESFGDSMNIVFLVASHDEIKSAHSEATDYDKIKNKFKAEEYSQNLLKNRMRIPKLVEKIRSIPELKIYGGGRILDGLVKHGDLDVSKITIADKYLWEQFSDLGITILDPEMVDWSEEGTTLILARSSAVGALSVDDVDDDDRIIALPS